MLLVALLLAAAQPPASSIPTLDAFAIGTDTLATVQARLGKPYTVVHNSDGTTMAIYASVKTHVKGSTFIPIIGAFAGGAKSQVSTKTFVFDPNGALKSYSSSDSGTDCSGGITGMNCH